MQTHKLGTSLPFVAVTTNAAGSLIEPDSTPTFTVYKNGVAVGALTDIAMTVVKTGFYRGAPAINVAAGFAVGDHVAVLGKAVIDEDEFEYPLYDGKVSLFSIDDLLSPLGTEIDGFAFAIVQKTLLAFAAGTRPPVDADGKVVFNQQDGETPQLTLTRGEAPGEITESVIASS